MGWCLVTSFKIAVLYVYKLLALNHKLCFVQVVEPNSSVWGCHVKIKASIFFQIISLGWIHWAGLSSCSVISGTLGHFRARLAINQQRFYFTLVAKMLSLSHPTHPHCPKANCASCPEFAHFIFMAFSLLWVRSWETETCIFWDLCSANLCWESSSCASSGTASKFSSAAEFNSFDLEKSSLPGGMSLPAELLWAGSTLPHKKDLDVIFSQVSLIMGIRDVELPLS